MTSLEPVGTVHNYGTTTRAETECFTKIPTIEIMIAVDVNGLLAVFHSPNAEPELSFRLEPTRNIMPDDGNELIMLFCGRRETTSVSLWFERRRRVDRRGGAWSPREVRGARRGYHTSQYPVLEMYGAVVPVNTGRTSRERKPNWPCIGQITS
eukprot:scaffold7670_cov160-Amphora_coffeaeformis.AAC.6